MQTFKASMIEAERLRGEQKETELRAARAAQGRDGRLADEFQAAVGNIVDTVSTASGELESAAGTLTKTAETTQQLSGVGGGGLGSGLHQCRSRWRAATEEMTGSVNEIARRCRNRARSPPKP